jgi:hypothetical protein
MIIQLRSDKKAIRVDVEGQTDFSLEDATQLARDLIDAVTQCGAEVKIDVEVPRYKPSDHQVTVAIHRVGQLRKALSDRPWNDVRANTELVHRVLEACL